MRAVNPDSSEPMQSIGEAGREFSIEGFDAFVNKLSDAQPIDNFDYQQRLNLLVDEIEADWSNGNSDDYSNTFGPDQIYAALHQDNELENFDSDGDLTSVGSDRYNKLERDLAIGIAVGVIGAPEKRLLRLNKAGDMAKVVHAYMEQLGFDVYAISGSGKSDSQYFDVRQGDRRKSIRISDHPLPIEYVDQNGPVDYELALYEFGEGVRPDGRLESVGITELEAKKRAFGLVEQIISESRSMEFKAQDIPATPVGRGIDRLVVDGIERSARNNRGQLLHWSEEGIRNFWRWFGESEAVDQAGWPMVMFHTTHVGVHEATGESIGDFSEFDRFATRRIFGREALDQVGSWFSDNPSKDGAGMYGGSAVYPVYLQINQPWGVRFAGLWRQAQKQSGQDEKARPNAASVSALDRYMDDMDIDGIRINYDPYEQHKEFEKQGVWVARRADQIKSAVGNSGMFDPKSANLVDPLETPELDASKKKEGYMTAEKQQREDSVVLIPQGQMAVFQKRLDALNKKATTFGLDPITVLSTEDVIYQRKIEYLDRDCERQMSCLIPAPKGAMIPDPVLLTRIEIEYPEVKLGNWSVVGKLEAIEGGNLAFSISRHPADEAALAERADHPIECEHCKTKRNRNDGYLLRDNESGEYKQVGSNCLEDFTGIDPAAALFLARMYQIVRISEGELDDFAMSGRPNAVDTLSYLADVNYIADTYGFVSAGKARDTGAMATYDEAIGLSKEIKGSQKDAYFARRDHDLAKAAAVRDWIANKPEESLFDRNLKLLLQSDALPLERKALAFAAASIPMHNRSLAATAEASKPSEHIGEPGQKMKANLTVDRVVPIETRFGYSDLVLMHDQDGNKVKWKTGACPYEIRDGGVGHTMEASFKIKEHDEYRGSAQTSVTHLKIMRWLDLENDEAELADEANGMPEIVYCTSIFMHPADEDHGYGNVLLNFKPLPESELLAEAKSWGINELREEGESVWLVSGPGESGNTHSLHLHDVDGREPSLEDFKRLADALDVGPERRVEVEPTQP